MATPARSPGPVASPVAPARPTPRVVVLARPGAAIGFRLAGAAVVEAPPGEEATRLRDALAQSAMGVVAVDEDVLAAVGAEEQARLPPVPVVLPFSMPRRWTEDGRGREWVAALVRRAVGYHVKLGEEVR